MTSDANMEEPGALLLDTENLFYRTEIDDCTEWLAAILWWSDERIEWVRDRWSYGQPWDKAVKKLEPLLQRYGFERIKVPAGPDAADHALLADLRHLNPAQPAVVGSGDARTVLSSAHALTAEGRVIFAITGHHGDEPKFRARFSQGGDLAGFRRAIPLRRVYREFLRAQKRAEPIANPVASATPTSEHGEGAATVHGFDLARMPWDELSPATVGASTTSESWQEKAAAILAEHGAELVWAVEFVEQLKPALVRSRMRYHSNEFTLRRSHWRRWALAATLLAGMWPTAATSSPATQLLAQADAVVMGSGDPDLSRAMELAHSRLRRSYPLQGELPWRLGRR